MSGTNKLALPTILFIAALTLSACASQPKEEPVVEPAPAVVETAPVPAPAPEAVAEPAAPAAVAAVEEPAPKPVVKKAKRKVVKAAPPKIMEPEPMAAPAPEPAPVAAPVAEPAPPAITTAPLEKAPAPGFFEQYWLWLLGIVVAVIAVLFLLKKKD